MFYRKLIIIITGLGLVMVAKGDTSQEQSSNVNDEQKSSEKIFNIGENIDGKLSGTTPIMPIESHFMVFSPDSITDGFY